MLVQEYLCDKLFSSCQGLVVLFLWFPSFNTLKPRQNDRHLADDIFKRIFMNKNV